MSLTNSPFWMSSVGGASFYDYEIDNSARMTSDNSSYLQRTPSVSGNRDTWTFSCWMKRTELNGGGERIFGAGDDLVSPGNHNNTITLYFDNHKLRFRQESGGSATMDLLSYALYRDTSAWYHIVAVYDSTNGTSGDRARMYVNGERITALSINDPDPGSGTDSNCMRAGHIMRIGRSTSGYHNHNLAEVHWVDGSALEPTSFGETKSGVWVPKEYSGSYGTNGVYLKFANSAAFGTDSSGNGNTFSTGGLTTHDQLPDSPTNNFPILIKGYNQNLSEGSLKVERSSNANNHMGYFSTMGMKTGKWYAEVRYVDAGIDTVTFGVAETNERFSPTQDTTAYAGGSRSGISANTYVDWATYSVESKKFSTYNGTNTSYGVGGASGDIFMLAVDMDNNKFWIGKNGTWMASGNPAAGTNPTHEGAAFAPEKEMVFVGSFYAGRATDIRWNFGQDSTFMGATTAGSNADANGYGDFKYAPPSGFLTLCSQNMPAPTIDPAADDTPEDYFNTVLWTGTGSGQSITGMGFQPDWLWFKNRNGGSDHALIDSVRGVNKGLVSNSTAAEVTSGASNDLVSFDSDGFTTGIPQNFGSLGSSGLTIATWGWKAGGTASSNTDGSITSSVSANQDAGFSIVTWTGTSGTDTMGHGLGTAPSMIITKSLSGDNWIVYHKDLGATKQLYLDLTNPVETNANIYSVVPTSSVFTIGSWSSTRNFVSYCFAEKYGYSKFGYYTGNGSTDGGFIYTGFKPAFLICKNTNTSSHHWTMTDNKRPEYNVINKYLYANSSGSEMTGDRVDFLADGFKLRHGDWDNNRNGVGYIYMAFAENPFKYANAR